MMGSVSLPEIHVFIGLVKILHTDQGYSFRYIHMFTMCSTSVREMHVFVGLVDQSYNSQLGQASTEVSKYIEIFFAFICSIIQILHCSGVISTYREKIYWDNAGGIGKIDWISLVIQCIKANVKNEYSHF